MLVGGQGPRPEEERNKRKKEKERKKDGWIRLGGSRQNPP